MSMISYALNGNMKKFWNNLKPIAEKTGRSRFSLFCNFLNCMRLTGCGYSDYLNYEFYKRSKDELKEYVTIKDQDKFYEIVSPSQYKTFFTIKPNFLVNFKDYISRDFFYQGTKDELKKFLKKHDVFMFKPIDGLGGHGVEKKYSKDIKDIDEFFNKLNEGYFLEEYVVQHHKISELCSCSVNTLRIMTFGYNGKSRIIGSFMRIGNGEADVDNFHQGGMGCIIDPDTGKCVGDAINKDLVHYKKHPKSGIQFDGFQIPNWDIVKKTVLDAALVNDHIHVVGWDVAVTEDGCTLIEGNRRPGFDLVQVDYDRGRKDIMRDILEEINENEGTNYKI